MQEGRVQGSAPVATETGPQIGDTNAGGCTGGPAQVVGSRDSSELKKGLCLQDHENAPVIDRQDKEYSRRAAWARRKRSKFDVVCRAALASGD
jgi:hypothetical protein